MTPTSAVIAPPLSDDELAELESRLLDHDAGGPDGSFVDRTGDDLVRRVEPRAEDPAW